MGNKLRGEIGYLGSNNFKAVLGFFKLNVSFYVRSTFVLLKSPILFFSPPNVAGLIPIVL